MTAATAMCSAGMAFDWADLSLRILYTTAAPTQTAHAQITSKTRMITNSSTVKSSELLLTEAAPLSASTEGSWFSMSFGTGVGAAEAALLATTMVVECVDVSTVLP